MPTKPLKRKSNPFLNKQEAPKKQEQSFGNLDKDNQYAIPDGARLKELGMYVLLHFDNFKEADIKDLTREKDTGQEDARTRRIGSYTPRVFHEFTRENEKEGKTNNFHMFGGKYIVLHDPSLDEIPSDDREDLMSNTKSKLLDLVKALDPQPTDEELKGIETANKATIIELITKYKTA